MPPGPRPDHAVCPPVTSGSGVGMGSIRTDAASGHPKRSFFGPCLGRQNECMTTSLSAANSFMATHGRLLDRRRFQLLLGDNNPDTVQAALDAHRNPDGGYGWGLEPDLRAAESQPGAAPPPRSRSRPSSRPSRTASRPTIRPSPRTPGSTARPDTAWHESAK